MSFTDNMSKAYVYMFCLYISFETIILNLLPSFLLGTVRYGIEIAGYLMLAIIIFTRLKKIELGKQDRAILILFAIMLVNIFVNMVNFKIAVLGLRWILRYTYLYFLITWTSWKEHDAKKFLNLIKVITFIEIGLGLLQLLFRDFADSFLLPRYENIIEGINAYALQAESKYAIYASFGRYGEFGYF